MRPTSAHINTVCKPGQGAETCRFLCTDGAGHVCVKKAPEHQPTRGLIEEQVNKGLLEAQGDNCEGVLR